MNYIPLSTQLFDVYTKNKNNNNDHNFRTLDVIATLNLVASPTCF
jgi:hypothetical protein